MLANIAANLIADVVWAPVAWLAYRVWQREQRRHRAALDRIEARLADALGVDDQPEGED